VKSLQCPPYAPFASVSVNAVLGTYPKCCFIDTRSSQQPSHYLDFSCAVVQEVSGSDLISTPAIQPSKVGGAGEAKGGAPPPTLLKATSLQGQVLTPAQLQSLLQQVNIHKHYNNIENKSTVRFMQAGVANGEIQQNGTTTGTTNQGQSQVKTVVNSSNVMSVQGLQGQIIQVNSIVFVGFLFN
jgi:hypothetical protein